MPERLSPAFNVTCALSAYQPVASGALTEAEVTGGVVSMWMPLTDAVLALPALSLTLAETPRLLPSPPIVLLAGHAPSMPDRASEQAQATITLLSYQPFAFGPVVAAPDSDGAVLSTLMPVTDVVAVLPALSVAVPDAVWLVPSPRLWLAGQDLTPERFAWSAQAKLTVTSSAYQPLPFGARSAAAVTVGGVRSMLTVAVSLALLPALSVPVPCTCCPPPSVVTLTGGVQLATPEPASVHVNVTVTVPELAQAPSL